MHFRLLIDEINAYDEKTKEQEKSLGEQTLEAGIVNNARIKDYKKTSMLKPVTIFQQFLRKMETGITIFLLISLSFLTSDFIRRLQMKSI